MRAKKLLFAIFALTLWWVIDASAVVVETVITNGLFEPRAVAIGDDGSIFITDSGNHRVVKYSLSTAQMTTFAGFTGINGTNDGSGVQARFNGVSGIVVARGGLFVSDTYNHTIRFITYNGTVTTIAGSPGVAGFQDGRGTTAKFRFPIGLAADSAGNIYIADSKNNAIRVLDTNNNVTTLATGFNYPAGITYDGANLVWVADKLNHQIRTVNITNGVVNDIAGIKGQAGFLNSIDATYARFNSPQGLLWLGGTTGLIVADSENHLIRRLYYDSNLMTYSVETLAGIAGTAGRVDGADSIATFNTPIGLAFDPESGGFYVVDSKGSETSPGALRRIQLFPPMPPISAPKIGFVYMVKTDAGWVTMLEEADGKTFNNDVILAIKSETGVENYYIYGQTPANQFETNSIPDPDPKATNVLLAPFYEDGLATPPTPLVTGGYSDVTIKAISVATGRRASPVVRARIIFKTARPVIDGDNASGFLVYSSTTNAVIVYTIDGSDPEYGATNSTILPNNSYVSLRISTDTVFKARAYRTGFQPSDVVTKIFSATNNIANKISFGFDATRGEEASCLFIAAPGQAFNVPVTLSLLPAPAPTPTMYSLQYGVLVTNITPSIGLPSLEFETMLVKPKEGEENVFVKIPPAFYYAANITNTVIISNQWTSGFLGVLWMERSGETNLYNAKSQDLIKYSLPHDNLFLSSDRKVVTGSLILHIPTGVPAGSKYRIEIIRPSATSDGVGRDVFIDTPTNGSLAAGEINAVKEITIGDVSYLVGDVAPFRWFNGGDFGDGYLLNNDVMQVFQSAAYGLNTPPIPSDLYDAMDSCCVSTNGVNIPSTNLFNGNDTTINTIAMGDGVLDIYDIFVTYRRSIDPSLTWFKRYYTPSGRMWTTAGVTNVFRNSLPAQTKTKSSVAAPLPDIYFSAGDLTGSAGQTVDVPINVQINGDQPLKILLLNISIEPLDGSPAIETPIQFIPATALGAPSLTMSKWAGNYSAAWLNPAVAGVKSNGVLGTIRVTIPPTANQNSAYAVNFMKLSAGGFTIRGKQTGIIAMRDRSGSSFNDVIPDLWRLRYFGSISNLLSQADADADGDGMPNLLEYKAGTDPVDPQSRLQLLSEKSGSVNRALKLKWLTAPGKKYIVESASSLFSTNWTVIASNLTANGGLGEFTDTNTTGEMRFYRVRIDE
ncbi:MAG: FN3 associated domain-containing protein [Verrucomicrobiia bacterium]